MPVRALQLGGWLLTALFAAQSEGAQPVDELPPGFLEYLGSLVATDGDWVDALDMDEDQAVLANAELDSEIDDELADSQGTENGERAEAE